MTYPNFKNKHLEEALFNPQDYFDYKKKFENNEKIPKKYIIIYYPKILNYFKRKYKPKRTKLDRLISIYQFKDVGVVCLTGIGSPHAVTVMEELIALGGKEFFNIGSAGGLDSFGIFLCSKSIRDEGTSHHYISKSKFSYPDKELTKSLEKYLLKNSISFENGVSWTIDAPYRETKSEINKYKKENVKTVEMESSALFAVAKFRKVKIASAFVVSDLVGNDEWNPKFDAKDVNQKLNKLFETAFECLLNRN